jgi:hypothetical protein
MSVGAEQLGEARIHVDARQAQPIDRSAARDQRDRRRVTDEPVVFEWSGHVESPKTFVDERKVHRWSSAMVIAVW